MSKKTSIKLCNEALNSLDGLLSVGTHAEAKDLINKYDEWGLGIELICENLADDEILITAFQFDQISSAMRSMGIENSPKVEYLRKHNLKS